MADEIIYKVGIDSKGADKSLEKVKEGVEGIGDAAEKTAKETPKVAKGIKSIGVSFKSIAAATGIVILLQKAFEFLSEALSKNQKIADAIGTAFDAVSIVMNEVVNVLVDVYESVSESTENFDALAKVMSGAVTLAITPLKAGFYGISLAIFEAQLAWEQSAFGGNDEGKIEELTSKINTATDSLKEVGENALEAGKDIVENFGEAVTETGNIVKEVTDGITEIDVKRAISTAKTNKQLENSAKLAESQIKGLLEENDRLAEKQRQIRDDENASFEERIEANEKLGEILNKQEKDMLALAEISIASAQADLDQLDNLENRIALQDAINEKKGIEAQIEGFRSEQLVNQTSLENELLETKRQINLELKTEREREFADIDAEYEELFRLAEKSGIDIVDLEKKKADDISLLKKEHAEFDANLQKQINDTELANAQATLNGIINLFGEQSAAGKAAGIVDATINTYVGASKALAEGGIFGPAFAAIQIATGMATVNKIISQPLPQFADGGIVGGSGTGTSDSVTARLSKGESVINARSTRMFKPLLSTINEAGGGRSFAGNEGSGGQTTGVVKAFVVADDMTNEQDKLTKIRRKATI